MSKSIFISYNKGSHQGQNTALRLQTISNLYGLSVNLPSRLSNYNLSISAETKRRIAASLIFVAFSLEPLSPAMQAELEYAILKKKPIVVINNSKDRHINYGANEKVNEVQVNFMNEGALHDIADFLKTISKKRADEKTKDATQAVVGIGLGLLALWTLTASPAE